MQHINFINEKDIMDANIANILEYSSQHIKDFKLAIEFKYLMKNAPAGVYLLPEVDDIRSLHGVIFLRRGLYRGGIFRFTVKLPFGYRVLNVCLAISYHSLTAPLLLQTDTTIRACTQR